MIRAPSKLAAGMTLRDHVHRRPRAPLADPRRHRRRGARRRHARRAPARRAPRRPPGLRPLTDGTMALAAPSPSTIKLTTFIDTGLTSPVLITSAHDGTGRLFVVQQNGVVKAFTGGGSPLGTLLDVKSQVSGGGEQGLLGLAFHPDFETNRKFYVNFTNTRRATPSSASTRRRRRTPTGSRPAPAGRSSRSTSRSRTTTAATSSSGRAATCSSGWATAAPRATRGTARRTPASCWARCSASTSTAPRARSTTGSPRRTPTSAGRGANEIWLRGLRNPWRYSFDKATNRLWIGDVGQGRHEEVDRISMSQKGANLGWRTGRGLRLLQPVEPLPQGGHGEADPRLLARRRSVRDHRRLRVPRLGHPGAEGLVRVRRLLQR